MSERKRKKPISKALRNKIWINTCGEVFEGRCYCCRQKIKIIESWHCGHIIAEARGGETKEENLKAICATCNLSMGTKDMNEFRQQFAAEARCCLVQ